MAEEVNEQNNGQLQDNSPELVTDTPAENVRNAPFLNDSPLVAKQPDADANVESTVEQVAEQAPDIDADLVAEAKTIYGYTDDDIAEITSSAQLRRDLARLDRRAIQSAQQQQPQPQQNQQQPQQQTPPAQQQPQAQQNAPSFKVEKYVPKLTKDYDPEIAQEINAINDYYHEQNQSLRAELVNVVNFLQGREADRAAGEIDEFFTELGPDWEGEFGKGQTFYEMDQSSQAFKNRMEVINAAKALAGNSGTSIRLTKKQWLRRALRSKHGDADERRSIKNDLRKQNGRAAAMPSSSNAKHRTDAERVANRQAEKVDTGGQPRSAREQLERTALNGNLRTRQQ